MGVRGTAARVGATLALLVLLAGGLGSKSRAAVPESGRIGPSHPVVEWSGPVAVASALFGDCSEPAATCDEFRLRVAVPQDYWKDRTGGARIVVAWASPKDHLRFSVYDDDTGAEVASGFDSPPVTRQEVIVPEASGDYRIVVRYIAASNTDYQGVATFLSGKGRIEKGAGAVFDPTTKVSFAPSTIVSAHFLGAEPQITMERLLPGSERKAIDPNRIFIDWPLTSQFNIGQLSRSTDGGASFRLLFDPMCPERSRPNCQSGGGGDTENEVNPFTGIVYFADQEVIPLAVSAAEALASSTDHGDTFPPSRQYAVTNTTTDTDREWIAAARPGLISVEARQIEAFFAYHSASAGGQYIQGIDSDGVPIPQPVPQLLTVNQSGPIRVDNSEGPGAGWIYQAFKNGNGFWVGTAFGPDYQQPSAWVPTRVSSDVPSIFPWLALDDQGNAYATWVDNGVVYYSFSAIRDPRNNPERGGRPGSRWSPQLRISLPDVGSAIFASVVAGDGGRIGIVYMGTEEFDGPSDEAPQGTPWHAYAAVLPNALSPSPLVATGVASHRITHTGNICTRGAGCAEGEEGDDDRSLLDLIDVGIDRAGRLGVAFMDNHSTFASPPDSTAPKGKPFTLFAKQVSGPSLLASESAVAVPVPRGGRVDPLGDATWPNRVTGEVLRGLDLRHADLALEGKELVATIRLARADAAFMIGALEGYNESVLMPRAAAERLQYLLRFATDSEVFHVSLESDATGSRRAFGGMLDNNDQISNLNGRAIAVGYHTDEKFPVAVQQRGSLIVLRAPARAFGLAPCSRVFSATAFALAGPAEEDETSVFDVMRTVDATPPFDTTLSCPRNLPR
ncbi:MAG: hypothetical protein ABR505_05455 [Actinomycetota bacterium]